MSKIYTPLLLAALILCNIFLAYWLFFQTPRYAYVDSAKLLNGYKGMIKAKEEYKKKAQGWQSNIDTLMADVQGQIMDYEKGVGKMNDNEKKLAQELIKTKQQQLGQYQEAIRQKAAQEDQAMTGSVVAEVNAYLREYGKASGYRIIFATTGDGNIAYAEEGIDLTEEILEGLNNQYDGK